jgi:hypothetical protein
MASDKGHSRAAAFSSRFQLTKNAIEMIYRAGGDHTVIHTTYGKN